jgi:chromosome segregation ATPase
MLNSQKKSILKKITNYDKGGIFMTNPSLKKKRKTIKMQTENYKKEKEQILKQIELSDKIKEIEHRIQLELEQYNIVINKKKEELSHIEKRVKQINDKNESLNMAYEKIKKEMEDKYNNKNKLKENKNLNNDKNDIIREEDPLVIKIKENENIIEDTRKTMENYQKEINKLENIIFDDENLNQINKIKFEIKNVKERLNTLEKEKKYLLIVSEEHNKCIEAQDKIKKEIEYYNTELNKLKIEKNQNYKEKKEKYKNDMVNINKNTKKINDALLAPHEVEKIKEKKIKSTLNKFWVINKQNLLKYSLSDNNINMNTIPIKKKKEKIINT